MKTKKKKQSPSVARVVRVPRRTVGMPAKKRGRQQRRMPAATARKPRKKNEQLQSVRGMHDILPVEQAYWERVAKVARDIAEAYGFQKIETPIAEPAELFIRAVGENTDIVEKEMYMLKTGGGKLALRPEGTAGVARAYIQHGLSRVSQPLKMWYMGPMFRHEQPQAGRFREFHQWGIEIFGGEPDPIYDAQTILASFRFLEGMRVKNIRIEINSIGCRTCRAIYRKRLVDYYKNSVLKIPKSLCESCKKRLVKNSLRVLDCKNEQCKKYKEDAPNLLDSVCVECKAHLKNVLEYLDELSLPYALNPYLVRGLDYYNRTVFEMFSGEDTNTLLAGGRYDYLTEMLGGKHTSAVGAAAGIERLVALMKERGPAAPVRVKNKMFLIHVGDLAKKRSIVLVEEFRAEGVRIYEALGKDSLTAQLKAADKENARIALILGQKEVYEESIIIRDMKTGAQETAPLTRVVQLIKRRLRDVI